MVQSLSVTNGKYIKYSRIFHTFACAKISRCLFDEIFCIIDRVIMVSHICSTQFQSLNRISELFIGARDDFHIRIGTDPCGFRIPPASSHREKVDALFFTIPNCINQPLYLLL